MIECYY